MKQPIKKIRIFKILTKLTKPRIWPSGRPTKGNKLVSIYNTIGQLIDRIDFEIYKLMVKRATRPCCFGPIIKGQRIMRQLACKAKFTINAEFPSVTIEWLYSNADRSTGTFVGKLIKHVHDNEPSFPKLNVLLEPPYPRVNVSSWFRDFIYGNKS